MLRVTRLTNYGITLLSCLAARTEQRRLCTRDLAVVLGLPIATTAKILKSLTRQGLLISHRGTAGGYRLARSPSHISLADVVIALEGPAAEPTTRNAGRDVSDFVHQTIYSALAGISLYEVAEQFQNAIEPVDEDLES